MDVAAHRLDRLRARDAARDERRRVLREGRGLPPDALVHGRLREARVVGLLVAVLAVAHEVDDDVAAEALPVLDREAAHAHDRLDVVAVDVEDRRLDDLGDVGAVPARARLRRRRREADLVVDDDVHDAAAAVAVEAREAERLVHDALRGEGGVAVHDHRQTAPPRARPRPRPRLGVGVGVGVGLLLRCLLPRPRPRRRRRLLQFHPLLHRARAAGDERVDRLEVRRVGHHLELQRPAAAQLAPHDGAEMVLDVARHRARQQQPARQLLELLEAHAGLRRLGRPLAHQARGVVHRRRHAQPQQRRVQLLHAQLAIPVPVEALEDDLRRRAPRANVDRAALDDAAEVAEDLVERLASHVGEHVEPAAVRHAQHDVLDAELARAHHRLLHPDHQRLAALEAEALGQPKVGAAEGRKRVGPAQVLQRVQLLIRRRNRRLDRLELVAQPAALLLALDVHELDTNAPRVHLLEAGVQLTQRQTATRRREAARVDDRL